MLRSIHKINFCLRCTKIKKNQYYERRRFTAQERCWRAGGGGVVLSTAGSVLVTVGPLFRHGAPLTCGHPPPPGCYSQLAQNLSRYKRGRPT